MSDFDKELKEMMRAYLADKGAKVEFTRYLGSDDPQPSPFGWQDHDAVMHTRSKTAQYPGEGCHWVIPEGSVVQEERYYVFEDTDQADRAEVGLNVKHVDCACGEYKDVTLRVTASLGEAIKAILRYESTKRMEL